jgi:hypothetical protein
MGQSGRPLDEFTVAAAFPATIRSHIQLLRTLPVLSLLSAEHALAYLEHHDPSRFWTATVLALGVADDPTRTGGVRPTSRPFFFVHPTEPLGASATWNLTAAAAAFAPRAGVTIAMAPFTQPEAAWEAFLAGLRSGQPERALGACTGLFARELLPRLRSVTANGAASLAAISGPLTRVAGTSEAATYVVGGRQVTFAREDLDWLVAGLSW